MTSIPFVPLHLIDIMTIQSIDLGLYCCHGKEPVKEPVVVMLRPNVRPIDGSLTLKFLATSDYSQLKIF